MESPKIIRIIALALSLAIVPHAPSLGQALEEEEITIIVPFAEGGGTDRWARFYAEMMLEHFPDSLDEVEVENEPDERGPIVAVNKYAKDNHRDGLTLLGSSASVHFPFLFGDTRVEYDYDDWDVLVVSPSGGIVYVSDDFDIDSHADDIGALLGVNMRYLAQSSTGIDIVPLLALDLLGIDLEVTFGAMGRSEGYEAFDEGDVDVDFQTTAVYLDKVSELVRDGDAFPLFALGIFDSKGELKRDPSFPDIPHFGEVYRMMHGESPRGEKWEIWKSLMAAGFSAQKMLFVQKSAPTFIRESYAKGLKKTVRSKDFRLNAPATLGRYPQYVGADARRIRDLAISLDAGTRKNIGLWLVNDALPKWTHYAE